MVGAGTGKEEEGEGDESKQGGGGEEEAREGPAGNLKDARLPV